VALVRRAPIRAITAAPQVSPFEKHYTPQELAELWNLDVNTIRRTFQDEPGVLKISNGTRGKRIYVTLRIPAAVVQRVYQERIK
jgi:hypothetical protein